MDCQLEDMGYTAVNFPAIEFAADERTLEEDGFRVRFSVVEAENGDDLRFAVIGPNDEQATLSDEDAIQFFVEDPDDSDLLWPTQPVVVINAANSQRLLGESRRPVASVSFVTHGFWTVEAYAEKLCTVGSERAITARLTHAETATKGSAALEFGDCHTDPDGNVGEPPSGHDHHEGTDSSCGCSGDLLPHKDTATDHVKCLSHPGYWHAFTQPTRELTGSVPDRGVKYVQGYPGLDGHLKEYGQI